jgi:hypothetical protein
MSPASTWARHCKELRCVFAAFKSAVSTPSAIVHPLLKFACLSARTGSSHSRNNLRGYEFRDVVLIAPTRAKVVAPVSSEGRSCVYVPTTHNGKVVDSQRIHTRPGRRMSGGRCAALQGIELFSSVYGFAVVNMPRPRARLIDQQPVARKPMQKPPLDPPCRRYRALRFRIARVRRGAPHHASAPARRGCERC